MKTKLPWILTILLTITLVVIVVARPNAKPSVTSAPSAGEKKVLYWIDAMTPGHKSDKPGKAPDGMDLVPAVGSTQRYDWDETSWTLEDGYSRRAATRSAARRNPGRR